MAERSTVRRAAGFHRGWRFRGSVRAGWKQRSTTSPCWWISAFEDGVNDPTPTRVKADLVGGMAFIGDEVQRPDTGPPRPGVGDADRSEDPGRTADTASATARTAPRCPTDQHPRGSSRKPRRPPADDHVTTR